ncbi:CCAAT/enhancer-binding protein gamma-like [Protopterus annectens]|uniref:CCAAT/enhancer-binding protein gamma-like n=1 Tax=Protopterus annectens TaxID=7888 RepID=UPI001CF98615|nr:CCAAT/enhancer-binding protein gamma-like [Protopterus annectens]XP_043916409.1 CCAAT/enhancer-binding protein gamma-like [Protopterus annectens]XP_043916410.1 CCAAT/enhancer-binding protein gamma-like [Protopterus annectens]XP_043916411.1 CCAAT/enhancer-binding protein gamma-like [Protopterus annectens]
MANQNGVIHALVQTGGSQQVPQLMTDASSPGGKSLPTGKQGKKNNSMDRNSDEYRHRRERNNMAVKKSRLRSKQKAADTLSRVNQLKEENERLEAKIKLLSKELSVLKDLFLEHAHSLADNVQPVIMDSYSQSQDGTAKQ